MVPRVGAPLGRVGCVWPDGRVVGAVRGVPRGGWYVPPVFGPLPGFSHFGPVGLVGAVCGVPVGRGG